MIRSCSQLSTLAARSFSSSATPEKFRILGLQQIAIGGLSKGNLSNLWVDLLGAKQIGTFKSEKENVDEDILSLGRGLGKVEIDIMQPLDPEKSPKVHLPPLNHIGLWVDNLPLAVEQLTAKGVVFAPGGIRTGGAGLDICFIHPKPKTGTGGEGVLIELVQATEEVIAEYDKTEA